MLSVNTTPRQQAMVRGLVACGYFANASEVGRAAIEHLVNGLTGARRRRLALHLLEKGHLDVVGVADVMGVTVEEAQAAVAEAGRAGGADLATFRRLLATSPVQERLLHMASCRHLTPGEGMERGSALDHVRRATLEGRWRQRRRHPTSSPASPRRSGRRASDAWSSVPGPPSRGATRGPPASPTSRSTRRSDPRTPSAGFAHVEALLEKADAVASRRRRHGKK